MPDKLTDNEIKKALECCGTGVCKAECFGYFMPGTNECTTNLTKNALDLINRLQEKNSNLTSDLTSLQNNLTSLQAENERLRTLNSKLEAENYSFKVKERENPVEMALLIDEQAEQLKTLKAEIESKQFRCDSCDRIGLTSSEHKVCIQQAKAEAYKEFAELVKKHSYFDHKDQRKVVAEVIIDHYLKKLVGEDNG